MTTRRGFLAAILATAAAPAIVRPASLMPIYVPPAPRLLTLWGDGVHDDAPALQALFNGKRVYDALQRRECGGSSYVALAGGTYRLASSLYLPEDLSLSLTNCQLNAHDLPRGALLMDGPHPRGPRFFRGTDDQVVIVNHLEYLGGT